MQASFHIQNQDDHPAGDLYILAGKQSVSFFCANLTNNAFYWLRVYHFVKDSSHQQIATQLQEILTDTCFENTFSKVNLIWTFENHLLVPASLYESSASADMLELLYGENSEGNTQHEFVQSMQAYLVYKVPATIKNIFFAQFPLCHPVHQASLMPNIYTTNTDLLYAHFAPGNFCMLLRQNGQLIFFRHFDYATPEDAAYHILSTCKAFQLDSAKTVLQVAGMINEDSALYLELYKYLQGISFIPLPAAWASHNAWQGNPPHYFSHLFAIAACV